MKEPIISFDKVTKEFNLLKQRTFKEFLPALIGGKETQTSFKELDSISFTVNKGETMGIVGRNGSGKSTILKLMAGVMCPTSGKVEVKGRVSPLIELGAGFHPELTGKENIYLNGAILGLDRRQINSQLNNIVEFAELEKFIDQPIKHYSSGMYMRLAFAVAVHANPEILLIDEILAVGDTAFQAKCFQKMEYFKKQGVTIIFVSHSLETVKNFCHRAIWLDGGRLKQLGKPASVVSSYLHT